MSDDERKIPEDDRTDEERKRDDEVLANLIRIRNERQRKAREKERAWEPDITPASLMSDHASGYVMTTLLILANIVLFVLEARADGSDLFFSNELLVSFGALYPPIIQEPVDLLRFVITTFLHTDIIHLVGNMVLLFLVASMVEGKYGKLTLLFLFLLSGITGSAAAYIFDTIALEGAAVYVGASTSIFGLAAPVLLLTPLAADDREKYAELLPMLGVIVVVLLVLNGMDAPLSLPGHLGGLIGGVLGTLMLPTRKLRTPVPVRIAAAVVTFGALAAIAYWIVG